MLILNHSRGRTAFRPQDLQAILSTDVPVHYARLFVMYALSASVLHPAVMRWSGTVTCYAGPVLVQNIFVCKILLTIKESIFKSNYFTFLIHILAGASRIGTDRSLGRGIVSRSLATLLSNSQRVQVASGSWKQKLASLHLAVQSCKLTWQERGR